jgi:hypothetical protein
MERRAPAFGCFAVPAAIFALLAQELIGQCVVWFLQIRTDAEDSAVLAGLRFAVKVRSVVEPLEHEPLVDAVDHFASLLAGAVETEVLQDDETVEGHRVDGPKPNLQLQAKLLSAPANLKDGILDRRWRGNEPLSAGTSKCLARGNDLCSGRRLEKALTESGRPYRIT